MEQYSFALDCNGGDYAPLEIVRGDGNKIEPILSKAGGLGNPLLEIVHAPDNVGFHEPPSSVLKKKNSSL